jgi:ferredoxin-type protein NapF
MRLSRHSKHLRPAVQALFLVGLAYLFIGLAYPASMPLSNPLMASDPLLALAALLYYRGSWTPFLALAGALLAGSALLGRVFCGWACPVGFLAEVSGRLSIKIKKLDRRFGYVQYGLLAAVLLSAIVSLDVLSLADPLVIFQRSLYLVLTLSGVPVALLLIMAGSLLVPRLWCRICPLGGLLGAASLISPFGRRLSDRCTGCMKCRSACSMGAISSDNRWDTSACTKCLECEGACPEGAISFRPSKPSPEVSPSRRSVLAAGAFLGFLALSKGASAITRGMPLIRPPGSLVESRFNAACARCEACAKACPGRVIKPAPIDAGLDRFYTPRLSFEEGKCERCGTCGTVCPTGAIISPQEDDIKIGTAALDRDKCLAWKHGKKCLVCGEVCPKQAVIGQEALRPVVDGDACIGCGSCELNCPASEKAITVSSAGERRRDG